MHPIAIAGVLTEAKRIRLFMDDIQWIIASETYVRGDVPGR